MAAAGPGICGIMVRVTTGYEDRDGNAIWAGRQLREWIPTLVESIVARFDPVRVIVFGSVASGTDGPDSDLDGSWSSTTSQSTVGVSS